MAVKLCKSDIFRGWNRVRRGKKVGFNTHRINRSLSLLQSGQLFPKLEQYHTRWDAIRGDYVCECKDYVYRYLTHGPCKHILGLMSLEQIDSNGGHIVETT